MCVSTLLIMLGQFAIGTLAMRYLTCGRMVADHVARDLGWTRPGRLRGCWQKPLRLAAGPGWLVPESQKDILGCMRLARPCALWQNAALNF